MNLYGSQGDAGTARRVGALFVCASILTAVPAFSQSRSITGVVRDPQRAVVVGAQVELIAPSAAPVTTSTEGEGRYRFGGLVPGRYVVEVRANGFQMARGEVSLAAGQDATHDVGLELAGAAESVTVTASGGVARGYRVDAIGSVGPLGATTLLNTPNTISVLPSELMQNAQVKNFKEASKFLPLVQFQEMQGSEVLRPATRGMQGSNMQNARMDGMGIVVTGANSIETLQQIEVLNGLGGALYGPANPSGMFNFVPKRPTVQPFRQVTVGYDNHAIGTVHADVGGRAGRNRIFGYRANALFGGGDAFVKGSHLDRRMTSLAGDVQPFTRTTIEGFFNYYKAEQRGFPGWFTYGRPNNRAPFILLPADAPDPARQGYGQSSAGLDLTSRIVQARVKQALNANWQLSAGVLRQWTDRDISTQVNALTSSAGAYTSSLAVGFAPRFGVTSDLAHLNGRLDTGSIRHDVAVGTSGYTFNTFSDVTTPPAASVLLGTASIAEPVVFALPPAGIPTHDNLFKSSAVHQQGLNASDTVTFDAHWSVRVTASQDWIWTDNYNNAGVRTGGYSDNGISPLGSLIYKPAVNMTLYATYGSSLQQGDLAPGTAANAGQSLEPYRSRQTEVGYKIAVQQVTLSTAVFRINRPFAITDVADNVFKIAGNQINTGLEAMLSGRVAERVIVSAGFTVIDTNVSDTGNPTTDGRHFVGIPKFRSNALVEYQVPVGTATFLSVNWQAVGRRPIDDINSSWTPSYNVIDLGARYGLPVLGQAMTLRLGVNNLTDAHYWSTLGPGNITGSNIGSYTAHLGSPRTAAASMTVAF